MTQRQERFCQLYVESGNATLAYRHAFRPLKASAKSIHERASRLLATGKIQARLAELRAPAVASAQLTLQTHLDSLRDLRDEARSRRKYSAAVQAEIARGRAAGFYTESLRLVFRKSPSDMTDEELAAAGRAVGLRT